MKTAWRLIDPKESGVPSKGYEADGILTMMIIGSTRRTDARNRRQKDARFALKHMMRLKKTHVYGTVRNVTMRALTDGMGPARCVSRYVLLCKFPLSKNVSASSMTAKRKNDSSL